MHQHVASSDRTAPKVICYQLSKLHTQKDFVMPASEDEAKILALTDSILQNISHADPGRRQLCYNCMKQIGDALGITNLPNTVMGGPIKSLSANIAI